VEIVYYPGGGGSDGVVSNSDFLPFKMKESLNSVGAINTLDQRLPKCARVIRRDRRPVCRLAVELAFIQCVLCRLLIFLLKDYFV